MAEEGVALKDKVQELLDSAINPAVAGHGGYIELIDVKDSTVYIRMSGGCQGCGAAEPSTCKGAGCWARTEAANKLSAKPRKTAFIRSRRPLSSLRQRDMTEA